MLGKNKGIFSNTESENIITEGSSFNGSINTGGSIRVLGEITGSNVKADKVYIKPAAKVKANLDVNNLFVEGVFIGDVRAEVRVVLSPTAKVVSNISTKEMVTSEGVMFTGNCKVSNESVNDIDKYINDLYSQKQKVE